VRDFLDFLMLNEGFVEIRSIRDGKVRQWFSKDRQAAVDLALEQSDQGWDAYFGVLPRTDMLGDAEHITDATPVLWADLDAKVHGDKQTALRALVRYRVPPSVVVDSGHGYHAYWKLKGAIRFALAQKAMKGIASQLKGDHVYDQARILRIPGTTNWKDPEHPVPVRTVVFNTENTHRFGDFHYEVEQSEQRDRPPRYRTSWGTKVSIEELPGWLTELVRDGVPQGQRSEAAFKVMIKLAERGWSDAEIKAAFEQGGIGEKMREQRNGDRWFDHSMKKAREQA
jgi:hypothetical protein